MLLKIKVRKVQQSLKRKLWEEDYHLTKKKTDYTFATLVYQGQQMCAKNAERSIMSNLHKKHKNAKKSLIKSQALLLHFLNNKQKNVI